MPGQFDDAEQGGRGSGSDSLSALGVASEARRERRQIMARQLCKGKDWDGKRWTGKTKAQEHGKRIEQWGEAQRIKEQWRQEGQQQLQRQQQQQRGTRGKKKSKNQQRRDKKKGRE